MRVVADTNVILSALLWPGVPHQLLSAAESGRMVLYTSPALVEELADVLTRRKFASRLAMREVTPVELVAGYVKLTRLILPTLLRTVLVETDPSDDIVLACALAARAHYVVSGDAHLLTLQHHHPFRIVSPLTLLNTLRGSR